MNINEHVKINLKFIEQGVNILDVNNTYIDENTKFGKNVVVYPNCWIEGNSVLKDGCIIEMNSKLVNAIIGENTKIISSQIIDSEVKNNTTVVPMSHLRNHCVIGNDCRIGNFVEMKNTIFGDGSKCAHLTYLGDCEVGEKVNFGCGVVTVNYDGKNKFRTIIKDRAFIGSNANLIAPVTIGEEVLVAAGTTVTDSVQDAAMAIGRVRQSIKEGYGKKYLNK